MAGVTAQGATFTFSGFAGKVTGISVKASTAELADMSDKYTARGFKLMVPTGDITPGGVTVDFLAIGSFDPQSLVKNTGMLTFSSQNFSISRRVVCVSASIGAQVGELVRGTMEFMATDFTG
jgi:hypothetical protein